MRVAVIGAGWAGMAAAVRAAQDGHRVTVFEAARTLGGRARAVQGTLPDGTDVTLDNGQHILIGAYTDTLRLMRTVGVDPDAALLRLPLALTFPDGSGLALPDAATPWDALAGILGARGWGWRDKLALLRTARAWQHTGFTCAPEATVADLCAPLTPRLLAGFVDPLCVSALNTPAARASGTVFLRVLQDAMFGARGGSNLLLPRTDLSALLPDAAARWLRLHDSAVHTGCRVRHLQREAATWRVHGDGLPADAALPFDRVVLATPAHDAARLLAETADRATTLLPFAMVEWRLTAQALAFESITTVYAWQRGARLPRPMLALHSGPDAPAQFVFDRGQLGGPPGLLALVVSASNGERDALQAAALRQAHAQLGLNALEIVQTVVEKRATFACTPGLRRPRAEIADGLLACGDYVDGPYPATLEGAVRSGWAVGA